MSATEEQLLERLARMEEKLERLSGLQKLADVFDSFRDLGKDVSLLTYPAVKMLTEELGEVETGFQLEDLTFALKRFLLSLRHIAWGLDQLENVVDWWKDMEPIMKLAVPHVIDVLEDLDQKGIFAGYKAMLGGYAKIAKAYGPEDIDAIAEGLVRMHGVAKKFSDPKFVAFVERLVEVPAQVDLDGAEPVGPLGLMWRLRNPESRRGLGIVAELTRALGKLKPGGRPAGEESE